MDETRIKQTIGQLEASIRKVEPYLTIEEFKEYCDSIATATTYWKVILEHFKRRISMEINLKEEIVPQINSIIKQCKEVIPSFNENAISDGYHTFDELYEFRKVYNAALFNEWSREWKKGISEFAKPLYDVHKSLKHHDGELCFGGGWFIVVAILPDGQISNHYKMKDWDLFKIPEFERALYPFDGHTGQDVINRLKNI